MDLQIEKVEHFHSCSRSLHPFLVAKLLSSKFHDRSQPIGQMLPSNW